MKIIPVRVTGFQYGMHDAAFDETKLLEAPPPYQKPEEIQYLPLLSREELVAFTEWLKTAAPITT